jgi:septum formation protein
MSATPIVNLVLASTSRYRQDLLSRIQLPFRVVAPNVDEIAMTGESPSDLSLRLAESKARAVAALCPGALVIGSDQVAAVGDRVLAKPGNFEAAQEQLSTCSGKSVDFYTAICLADARVIPIMIQVEVDITRVQFRALQADEIAEYLNREKPYDCAGSFKSEGLGIALFSRIDSRDPTALIGLPMLAVCRMLRNLGARIV